MAVEIGNQRQKPLPTVSDVAQRHVAGKTQQTPHLTGFVIVVNMQSLLVWPWDMAARATALALSLQHPVEFRQREPVPSR
jgi:hypothetical protein